MAMKGTSDEASLPDIIQLIAQGKRTGVLSITNRKDFGDIYFREGNIIYSNIVNSKFKICDILVNAQELSKQDAERIIEIQKANNYEKRIGEILIEENLITRETLMKYIKKQIEEALFTIFNWNNIYFNFEPNIQPPSDLEIISMKPEDILLRIATRMDEWGLLKDKIPGEDTILIPRKDFNISALEGKENEIFKYINGERSLKELYQVAPYTKFEVSKIIYILLNKKAILELGKKNVRTEETLLKAEEHKNLGIAFLKTDMYEEAIREFKTIIAQDKENAEVYFYIGLAYHKKGQLKEAGNYYQKSFNINEKNVALINNFAVLLETLGQYNRVEELYKKALSLDVRNKLLIANLGVFYFRTGRYEDASELLSEASADDQNLIFPLAYLAEYSLMENKIDNAISFLEEILDRKKKIPDIYYFIGKLYLRKGDTPKAEENFLNTLEIDSNFANAHLELAKIYYKRGKFSEAKEHLSMIIQLNGEEFDSLFKLGNIYFKERDFENALKNWEKALIFDPNNTTLRKNIRLLKEQLKAN